jgi:hypothetical protein
MMLELSSEDTLRLNVLINNVEAIRIEERTLTVFGLSARGEARVQLNPTGRSDQYLRAVREFLCSCALGSPSGYPVHLNLDAGSGARYESRQAVDARRA